MDQLIGLLAAANRFHECLSVCEFDEIEAAGSPFTWQKGELFEKLDRVVANCSWRTWFPNSSVTNLPIPFSDHCALWLRTDKDGNCPKPFKFQVQVKNSWRASDSWNGNIIRCTDTLKAWNKGVFGDIFLTKKKF